MKRAIELARTTVDLLRSHGLECPIVSGGGTGTYEFEAASGVYNEVQSGSYIFMDADYGQVEGVGTQFEQALYVLTTIISRTGPRAVCDAGLKASSIDSGMPRVADRPGIVYQSASDEHGTLLVEDQADARKPAINSASSRAIAIRRSTCTTGSSGSGTGGSNRSGRSRREGRFET